jgi:hypothetical protein
MIDKEVVSKIEDGRNRMLMEILAEQGKPYEKKHDGYAVKIEEDKQITYVDYNNTELTLTIPKGSYLMVDEDSSYPKIVTEKEFNDSNEFCEEEDREEEEEKEEEDKEEESPKESKKEHKIGMSLMAEEGNY